MALDALRGLPARVAVELDGRVAWVPLQGLTHPGTHPPGEEADPETSQPEHPELDPYLEGVRIRPSRRGLAAAATPLRARRVQGFHLLLPATLPGGAASADVGCRESAGRWALAADHLSLTLLGARFAHSCPFSSSAHGPRAAGD